MKTLKEDEALYGTETTAPTGKSPEAQERLEGKLQEIIRLRGLLREKDAGVHEMQSLVDALLTAMVLSFGEKSGEGHELRLPDWDSSLTREYRLFAEKSGGGIRLTARKREGKC